MQNTTIKNLALAALATLSFYACDNTSEHTNDTKVTEETLTGLFKPVATDYTVNSVAIPEGMQYDVLFVGEMDSVLKSDGSLAPAKEYADFIGYLPIDGSSKHGYLYVNQETRGWDDNLGDGGGGTLLEIKLVDGKWQKVGYAKHIDFGPAGGTLRNCGGTVTSKGTVLTAEETEPSSNASLYGDYRDTSDINGMARYLNFGWMVEVDPMGVQAPRKIFAMGRYEHEDAHMMPDNRTVYLTDDHAPGALFKFVADKENDFTQGQLSAFQAGGEGEAGKWLDLPRDMQTMLNAREEAFKLGATAFVRHEWIDGIDNKLYITETGRDELDFREVYALGATPAYYLEADHKVGEGQYLDPFGRVLELDLETLTLKPLVEGGDITGEFAGHFANPDGLLLSVLNGKPYLIINEDLNGTDKGRVGPEANDRPYCEVYFWDLTKEDPTRQDLERFLIGAKGAETTGSMFTPDGKTYFVSIQHPDKDNPSPFDHTVVIAVTGFGE